MPRLVVKRLDRIIHEHKHQQIALVAHVGDAFVVGEKVALEREQQRVIGWATRQRTVLELLRLKLREMFANQACGVWIGME